MAFPAITEQYGSLSYTGFAKEATFGTPVAATSFLPMSGNTMEEDPGWFSPHLMQNLRDYQVYNLQGEAKYAGAVTGPLFPDNAIQVLSASVGADAIPGWGVASPANTPTSTTTTLSTVTGATSLTLTSPTGFAVGQQIVVDTGFNQEFRKISNVAGSVITVADALLYPHASGITVTTGTTTTLSAPSTANATTVTVTSATGITANNTVIQIDVNSVSGTTTSEIRKVTNVVSTTLTLDTALVYAHATSAQVTIVPFTGPFTHTLNQQNTLPSLTVEKAIGGFQSLQFAGCRASKFDVKMPVGNAAAEVSIDLTGRSVAVLDSPTPLSITNDIPFVFAEANLSMYGTLRTETSNVALTIDNGVKETYTYSNQHGPSFITPLTLHTSGTLDLVFSSLDNATYGDFQRLNNQTLGSLQFSLIHPASAGTITFYLPQIALSKYANDLKMEDVVMSSMTYEATRPLTGPALFTIQATVVNNVYTAY